MINELKEINLGRAGIDFLICTLKEGTILSTFLDTNLIMHGKISTFLPMTVEEASLTRFDSGGKFLNIRGQNNTYPKAEELLKRKIEYAVLRQGFYLLAEHRLAKFGDAWLSKRKSSVFFIECTGSVIHFLQNPCDMFDIENFLKESRSTLPTVGIIFGRAIQPIPKNNEKINIEKISSFAKNSIKAIFVSDIYDGESFLWWEPRE